MSRLISGGGKLKIKHSVTGKWTLVSSSQQRNGAAAGEGFLRWWLVVKWKVPCGFGRQRLRQHASDMCLLHTAATTTTARKYVLNAVVCIVVCHTNGSPRNATHNWIIAFFFCYFTSASVASSKCVVSSPTTCSERDRGKKNEMINHYYTFHLIAGCISPLSFVRGTYSSGSSRHAINLYFEVLRNSTSYAIDAFINLHSLRFV